MAKQKTARKKTAGKSGARKKQQQERTYPKGVEVLSSKVSFEGPIFRVVTDEVMEPGGKGPQRRDVVRHGGSVVVLVSAKIPGAAVSSGTPTASVTVTLPSLRRTRTHALTLLEPYISKGTCALIWLGLI